MTATPTVDLVALPVRLQPGDDLRRALEARVRSTDSQAAFVVGGIGSLGIARIRLAGADDAIEIVGTSRS